MNNEELIMNSEKYKCCAFDVGTGLAFGKSEELIVNNEEYKYDANVVGAESISAQIKSSHAITLIALIITIIIMLILAGVVLTLTLGEHGIFKTTEDATKDYTQSSIKEELELAILDIQAEAINNEKVLTLGEIVKNLPEEFEITNITEEGIEGKYKGYNYEIDKDCNINSIEGHVKEERVKPRNKWNLGVENSDFITYQGTPEYKGAKEGVYLNNSILSTKENYILNNNYTIVLETKNISAVGYGFLLGFGYGAAGVGGTSLSILSVNNGVVCVCSGAGDGYSIGIQNNNPYIEDTWIISAIKWDGTEFSFFVNNKKIGSSKASRIIASKLYIGGISNSGTSSAGVYWGYASGYYRNLAIYNEALTDEELENYSF